MRTQVLAAAVILALPGVAHAGTVKGVSASSSSVAVGGPVTMTVVGTNPCGAVHLDYGDGNAVTHPITGLPVEITYKYARPGNYRIRAVGMGNCAGEAMTGLRVVGDERPQQKVPQQNTRFEGMDVNGDGVITRSEWRGSNQSFRVHDWNGDGVLSGEEIRLGARRQREDPDFDPKNQGEFADWTPRGFSTLDHNRDGRITRDEWHFDREGFVRADRNRDGVLSRAEFLGEGWDDDRDDRFQYMDTNNDGRLARSEWHGTRDAFEWLDRNNDGFLSRAEVVGADDPTTPREIFASLDVDRDGAIDPNEWHWSRRSFNARDTNGDGVISRREFAAAPVPVGTSGQTQTVVVPATQRWVDSGIDVQRGDTVTLEATGSIAMSADPKDTASPRGSDIGRLAPDAPVRNQPAGGLIVRFGESAPLYVGANSRTIQVPTGGRMYFSNNDDHLGDNRGEFRVNVRVQRR